MLCVKYCKEIGWGEKRSKALTPLALGVVTSDCHGKMASRAEKQWNDTQLQGAVAAEACSFCSDFRGS